LSYYVVHIAAILDDGLHDDVILFPANIPI
jgi:hypothetical protein